MEKGTQRRRGAKGEWQDVGRGRIAGRGKGNAKAQRRKG